jgi:hypothetical protein
MWLRNVHGTIFLTCFRFALRLRSGRGLWHDRWLSVVEARWQEALVLILGFIMTRLVLRQIHILESRTVSIIRKTITEILDEAKSSLEEMAHFLQYKQGLALVGAAFLACLGKVLHCFYQVKDILGNAGSRIGVGR